MPRGIPDVPLDGEQYAAVGIAGLAQVLEYDAPTGGYKLVVSTEAGVAINISGTVEVTGGQLTLVGGAQYGEDTPHLSGGTGTFIMGIRHDALSSTVDTDGDYAGLHVDSVGLLKTVISSPAGVANTNDANPTGVYTIAHLKAIQDSSGLWGRLQGRSASTDNVDNDDFGFNLNTNSIIWGINAGGNMDRIHGTSQLGLLVNMVSGSFPLDAAVVADTELPPAAALTDAFANPTVPGVGGFMMLYDGTNWRRVRGVDASGSTDDDLFDVNQTVNSTIWGLNLAQGYDRIRGPKERGLYVTMVSGSFPGQDAAIEIDDTVSAALRAGIVGGANLMYDVVGDNWEREPARIPSDAVAGSVMPQRMAFNMMWNYNTSTFSRMRGNFPGDNAAMGADSDFGPSLAVMSLVYGTNGDGLRADRIRGSQEDGLNVNLASGTWPTDPLDVNLLTGDIQIGAVEIKDGASDNRAIVAGFGDGGNPNQTGIYVAAFNMVYNEADANWDRLRADQTVNFERVRGLEDGVPYLDTISYPSAYDGAFWRPLRMDSDRRLMTTALVTGTVTAILSTGDIEIGAVEIKDADTAVRTMVGGLTDTITSNPTGIFVGAFNMMYDVIGDNWERSPARLPGDGVGVGMMPQVGVFPHLFDYDLGAWDRVYGGDLSADAISGGAGGSGLDNSLNTRSAILLNTGGTFTYDIARGSIERGMHVSMISGSFPGQDGAQLLADATANPYAGLVGSLGMIYDVVGSNWDRDPARVVANEMAAGVFPQRISHNMFHHYALANKSMMHGGSPDSDAVSGQTDLGDLQRGLNVRSILYGINAAGTFDRLRGDRGTGLNVTMVSGSWPTDPLALDSSYQGSFSLTGSTTLADNLANPTSYLFGAGTMVFDGTNWDRIRTLDLADDQQGPGANLTVSAANLTYRPLDDSWARMYSRQPNADNVPLTDHAVSVQSYNLMYDSVGNHWERLSGRRETGLNVTLISGSFPDGATAVLADGMANPNPLLVGSHLLGYNGVTWDRLYMGASGSLAVDLITGLDPVNDEVTAYVTGTGDGLTVNFITGSVVGIGGITKVIRREVVNISGSGGEFELIAANGVNRLKVTSMMLIVDADTNVHIQSNWTGTAVTGPLSLPADGDGFFLATPSTPDQFHFESEPGENLVLDQSAPAAIGGWIQYYAEA